MKSRIARIIFFALVTMLMLGLGVASSLPAMAQVCTGATCIASIDPSVIDTTKTTTFTISGLGFGGMLEPKVVFDGANKFPAQIIDDETLRTTVPAGSLVASSGHLFAVTVESTSEVVNGSLVVVPESSTIQPTAFARPLVVVQSYGPSSSPLKPGQTFALEVNLVNTGQLTATNTVITFFPGDFEPRETGGVRVIGSMNPGATSKVIQNFTVKTDLSTGVAVLDAEIRYTDPSGTAFTETARLILDIKAPSSGGGAPVPTNTPTPTPGAALRPQFVIRAYSTDVEPLKPGTTFTLNLDVANVGSAPAKAVSMIIGGGTASSGGDNGTPGAPGGGVSGSGGEFTNFAPINSSNVQVLGDVPAGGSIAATQALIVNSTTNPGAYSLKISFVYTDSTNARYTDDQVITLLVLQPPRIDVSFYMPIDGTLYAGQMGNLPLQVVNLSNASTVLGTMTVTAEGAEVMNNTLLVGNLEPGFPVTLDAQITPMQPGPLTLNVAIEYTDNFNQQQVITETLQVEVLDMPIFEPGMDGGGGEGGEGFPGEEPQGEQPQTFWQMVLRFIKGLFGLGSGPIQDNSGGEFPQEEMPIEEMPVDGGGGESQPLPRPVEPVVVPPKG